VRCEMWVNRRGRRGDQTCQSLRIVVFKRYIGTFVSGGVYAALELAP
jgi:hypothetical protein